MCRSRRVGFVLCQLEMKYAERSGVGLGQDGSCRRVCSDDGDFRSVEVGYVIILVGCALTTPGVGVDQVYWKGCCVIFEDGWGEVDGVVPV